MTAAQLALLAGLFAAPAVLLRLGGRLRRRGRTARGAFWGGVAGHTLGMAVALWAMLLPPVAWTGGSAWREAAVFGSLAAGALLGAALGAALASRRSRPAGPGRPPPAGARGQRPGSPASAGEPPYREPGAA